MKHRSPRDEEERFHGHLRHYHRAGSAPRRTWDEWVDGKNPQPGSRWKWLKIGGIVLAILSLGGIIAGLIIALQ